MVAATSRVARLFIKKALGAGHDVTALCRADSEAGALTRMEAVLQETVAEVRPEFSSSVPGVLTASNKDIFSAQTYMELLSAQADIDAICCFVGVTKTSQMINPFERTYTKTINAILEGIKQSRPVEVLYHSSVGTGGAPANAKVYWPANYPNSAAITPIMFPIFRNVTASERLFARSDTLHNEYIVFRPGGLRDDAAKGDYTSLENLSKASPYIESLKKMSTTINREDVADEILRVSMLSPAERASMYQKSYYLADNL
ncbi:MAG: hypothetical protein AAFW60_05735 [Pseudomonadota bacterium]